MKLRLILGLLGDEDRPVVAGAMDQSTYEIVDWEESDQYIADMKKAAVGGSQVADYEWREVTVNLDTAKVLAAFETAEIEGEVESVSVSAGGGQGDHG